MDDQTKLIREAGYMRLRKPGDPDPHAGLLPMFRGGKHQLNLHLDARGGLVELWRQSWELGPGASLPGPPGVVRQVYISQTYPGVVKGWHCHAIQTDRFVVLRGRILLCTYDLLGVEGGEDDKVVERVLDSSYQERVDVPPLHAHGWMALGNYDAWVLNLVSHEYDGTDEFRRPATAGPVKGKAYDWHRRRDG